MIHVNHKVARLKLIQLLERKCNFSRSGPVGLQAKLMKTIKYLMVGETTDFQCLIREALMQGFVHRSEVDRIISILKNMIKPFLLFFAITKYIECISIIPEPL